MRFRERLPSLAPPPLPLVGVSAAPNPLASEADTHEGSSGSPPPAGLPSPLPPTIGAGCSSLPGRPFCSASRSCSHCASSSDVMRGRPDALNMGIDADGAIAARRPSVAIKEAKSASPRASSSNSSPPSLSANC